MNDSTLKELWQKLAEKKSCEAKQKELTAQRDTLADRLKMLEKSNVDMVEQMTAMMSSQRALQSAAQSLKMYDQIMSKSVSDVGKL